MTADTLAMQEKFLELPLDKRLGFTLWLVSQIESNELEGESETAQALRGLMGFLSRSDLRSHEPPPNKPGELEQDQPASHDES